MKKLIYIIISLIFLNSCNDTFLERYPLDKLVDKTAFISYDNFKTYSWSLYNIFSDNNQLRRYSDFNSLYEGDVEANYLYDSDGRNRWAWQTVTPETAPGGWDFSFIRTVNVMLDNLDKSEMDDKDKAHWRSVGLFFRSYRYFELMCRFGNVPWLEHLVTEADNDQIFGPRTPRDEVAANILRDLKYAEENIKINGDGDNTINRNVVRALLSRYCLFEGTWRKYHVLSGPELYLQECARVSELLMDDYPTIADNFQHRMSTEDLRTYPGIILFKEYSTNVIMQTFCRGERGGAKHEEMHAHTIERYLCSDGKPITTSTVYDGVATMNDEFRNRDLRLLYRVPPPYRVQRTTGNVLWEYTGNPLDREYIDLMNSLDKTGLRPFPLQTWQPFTIDRIPHIAGASGSLAPMSNNTGYYMLMFYNIGTNVTGGGGFSTTDVPLFYIEEVLLNYAEVKFELGQFTQYIADRTINKLRPRAGVANMVVNELDDSFDPCRDPLVPPVLWEIRRERMAELMGDGFGFDDIRRWKRAEYFINEQPLGVRMDKTGMPPALKWVESGPDAGRCYRVDDPLSQGKGWLEHYYLYPIPQHQVALNPELKQNPEW